ncbi:histidinol-phosphate transaminase [Bacillus salipaludis]|uniref:histidinol-phosphate transaminase n=1 Tax=Bacillus salipaludis TaxID=2547811 RepID=UPI002E1B4C70|nr:histidinol-phosphate transaminase [Bacillus salipaludis]
MMMKDKITTRKEIENLDVYIPGKPIEEVQRELGLEKIIKLASNENPYHCSNKAKQAMLEEIHRAGLYPEGMAPALTEKLAHQFNIDRKRILVGNGSDEIIRLLTRSYIRASDEVIMADVTFPRYETNVFIEGGKPIKVPLLHGVHDLEWMFKAITANTRMIFICNPNNPTGTIVSEEELRTFIERVPKHILLIIDEAYYEYVTDKDYLQTVPLLDEYPNLIILRTFSKIYGLASLRIGYGMMHPSMVQELVKVKEPFNTNRFAQAAAIASLEDLDFVETCKRKNEEGRKYLENELEKMGLGYFPSQGNFLMVKINRSGDELFQSLLKQGIIVRSGVPLGYPETIRVSIGTEEENRAFISALKRVMESNHS